MVVWARRQADVNGGRETAKVSPGAGESLCWAVRSQWMCHPNALLVLELTISGPHLFPSALSPARLWHPETRDSGTGFTLDLEWSLAQR